MEKYNLKLEEKPNVFIRNSANSAGVFDENNVARQDYEYVPYSPAPIPLNISRSNARIHQFFPDQIPASGIDRMINTSHFSVSPTPNIELDSFGSIRSSNRTWNADANMNHFHVESIPCSNFVIPLSPAPLAAFPTHTPIENETLAAFQSNHPDPFGSFLGLGGAGNLSDSFENLDIFGSDVGRRSGIGTSMDCMNLYGNNASRVQDLHRELSGWNFGGKSPTIPSNSYMSSSPLSVFQRTQDGGPEVFFSRAPGNSVAQLGKNPFRLQDSQQNHAMDLSMESLFGSLNEAGSCSYQYQLLDHAKTRGKNLSRVSLLGRHNSQSNEAGSAWNSSAQTSVFPSSPSLRVSKSIINDDRSGRMLGVGVESRTGQCRSSLKRGAVQPCRSAPRPQRRRQAIQIPGQPIAETGPFLASSSQTRTHDSAAPQMFQQTGPTCVQTARPCLPTSAHRIKWKDSVGNRPIGKDCFLCKRDVGLGPEGAAAVKPRNPPTVAVLPCGHVCHVKCWEETAPGELSAEPPCFPCTMASLHSSSLPPLLTF